jgi:hypothetical protein
VTVIHNPEARSLIRGPLADVTREQPSPPDKPVLDAKTFHQLLSAAYTLQEHNRRRLVKEPKQQSAVHHAGKVLETMAFKRTQSKPAQFLPLVQQAVPSAPVPQRRGRGSIFLQPKCLRLGDRASSFRMALKRIYQSHELLWRAAMVVAGVGISALLLVGTKPVVMEQPVATKTRETPATTQTTVNPNRPHSIYESEADVVAKDTIVRYGSGSSRSSPAGEKQPLLRVTKSTSVTAPEFRPNPR